MEEAAVGNEPLLVGKRIAVGIRLAGHRAEFDETEDLLILPRPQLCEERIPFHLDRATIVRIRRSGDNAMMAQRERRKSNGLFIYDA